ncbi:MAG: chemotaxis-specific protein-glutamate methyltransferase CheB [Spirochaetota bacterium]|jgi:two-component system chemotaxis response regulator CheB|nr:chemotaxis-specific protein-glutamate methyltransferase CheB [Spirochaetota bacterium]
MINTLIVDDSSLVRDILRDFLESDGSFNIIGEAADGEEGLQKILSLNPDLVTLDVEMPKMTGLQVIDAAMKQTFVPIVVITSLDTAATAYEATMRGALEFYSKEVFSSSLSPAKKNAVYETLKRISGIKKKAAAEIPAAAEGSPPEPREIHAVVIASSTGGPKALAKFCSLLPEDFAVPIAIVQHNDSGFDKSFAEWLDARASLQVKLAEEGETPKRGTIYIAQTDRHLMLERLNAGGYCFTYNDGEPESNQKPAADALFRSAAESMREAVISVVLTGMGSDGARGTQKIREMGGITLAQDEETSLIYGMPKAAAETGCVDLVLPLERIPGELVRLIKC